MVYDNLVVLIHDEGYDGIWIIEEDTRPERVLFTGKDVDFSNRDRKVRYRLSLEKVENAE